MFDQSGNIKWGYFNHLFAFMGLSVLEEMKDKSKVTLQSMDYKSFHSTLRKRCYCEVSFTQINPCFCFCKSSTLIAKSKFKGSFLLCQILIECSRSLEPNFFTLFIVARQGYECRKAFTQILFGLEIIVVLLK